MGAARQYAQIVEVTGRTLTLSFSTEPIRRQYHSGTNEDVLCEALSQVLGIDCRIETVAGGPPDQRGDPGGRHRRPTAWRGVLDAAAPRVRRLRPR